MKTKKAKKESGCLRMIYRYLRKEEKRKAREKWKDIPNRMQRIVRRYKKNVFTQLHSVQFSSVQFSHSVMSDFATQWTAASQASLSITNSWSLEKLTAIELVMPSNHLILCCSLLLLPSIFPSIRAFSSESLLHIRWLKYWSFRFSISPSNEYSGLIYFSIDWSDLLVVQGNLKGTPQHHNTKASTFSTYTFLMAQLSHPYITIGKAILLTK